MFSMLAIQSLNTLYMTLVSTLFAYIFGLPLGIALVVTGKNGIRPNAVVNVILGTLINIFRAVPFLILLIAISPFTQLVTGTTIGIAATIVPLVVSATPFIARLVEGSVLEIDSGVIEAAQSMGASDWQIVRKVMLTEAKPAILVGSVVALVTILGYSAMAGIVGGAGLGAVAINYGLYKFNAEVQWITIAVIVILVQILQELGMWISRRTDNRI
ncbi:MAG: ABC transporter permease [Clostridiales bacterium]|nr:ABC transporter permease [Clostridiales bacterium]